MRKTNLCGCVDVSERVKLKRTDYPLVLRVMQGPCEQVCKVFLMEEDLGEDLQRVGNVTAASGVNAEIWIGLKKTTVPTWLWSVRKTHTSHGLAEYANWASLPNASHYCGGMRADGKWLSASCETEHPFVCQEGM